MTASLAIDGDGDPATLPEKVFNAANCPRGDGTFADLRSPSTGTYSTWYKRPGFVHIEVITYLNGKPDSVVITDHPPEPCDLTRSLSYHQGDSTQPPGVVHTASYDPPSWHGRWSGTFDWEAAFGQPPVREEGVCKVDLTGTGTVEWGAPESVIEYTGTLCGHEVTMQIDVTAGGKARCVNLDTRTSWRAVRPDYPASFVFCAESPPVAG